jgi:toxin FitB
MIILDTNVLSVLTHAKRPEPVMAWFKRQPSESLWTTAITIFEASAGIEQVAEAARRRALRDAFNGAVDQVLRGRILSFDAEAAHEAARLVAERKLRGRTVELRDTFIAGIARVRKATLATRNIRDFADAGIPLVDPWTATAG